MAKKLYGGKAKKDSSDTEAKKWLEKLERAREVKKNWYDSMKVALAYEYVEGRQMPPGWRQDEWITINLIYSNLRAILPTLYRVNPYFYVRVKRSYRPDPMLIAQYDVTAQVRQSMLNYYKEELDLKRKVRLAIYDSMFQYGVIKIHHSSDLIDNPQKGEILRDPSGNSVIDDNGEALFEPDYLPANDAYRIDRVHPNDIVWDEDSGPLEDDWGWIAQRITAPLSDVQNDKRYSKKARDLVTATEKTDDLAKQHEKRKKGLAIADKPSENDVVVKWEVYDLKHKEWMVLAEGCNEFLIKPEPTPPGIEDHPFAFLRWFLRDSSPYPIPPVSTWIDPQREYCEARSRVLIHRKRFNRKYQVWNDGLESPEEKTKLEYGQDGTCISITQPQSVVFPILDAPLDSNNFQELLMLRKDFDDVAVGANQRGSATGVDSATEAGILEQRTAIKEGDDVSQVADFVALIAEKLDMQIQVHISEDQAVKVTGPDGRESWHLVSATDYQNIEGEYQYSVNVGQMQAQLPEIERAQFTSVLSLLMSAPQLMLSERLLKKIAEMYNMDDETLVKDLKNIAMQMMSGQIPMSGQQGSAPGGPMMPGAGMTGKGGVNNFRGGAQ